MLASKCSYSSPLIFFIKKLPKKWSNNGPKGIIFLRTADPYIFCKKICAPTLQKRYCKRKPFKKTYNNFSCKMKTYHTYINYITLYNTIHNSSRVLSIAPFAISVSVSHLVKLVYLRRELAHVPNRLVSRDEKPILTHCAMSSRNVHSCKYYKICIVF